MADLLRIGLSALVAQQRALSVTANNIANASTPGYTRRRIELAERPVEQLGRGHVGTGVDPGITRRLSDDLLAMQLRQASSTFHRSETFAALAAGIDDLLADGTLGLNANLQRFTNAVQDLSNDPASSAARQAFLSAAHQLVSTFRMLDARTTELAQQADAEMSGMVAEIGNLAQSIASLNRQVLSTSGTPAPDVLDQRDRLLERLAELVQVQTVEQQDGTLSVFIGSGQALVLGTQASQLVVVPGEFGASHPDIAMRSAGGDMTITRFLRGGALGGLLDFRREMLDPVRNEIGRIAAGLVQRLNGVHREGMDLNGQLGGDLFSLGPPLVLPAGTNGGAADVAVGIEDASALEASSYQLLFDGVGYQLMSSAGAPVAMSGSGTSADPLRANGLSIVISGAPAAGDRFLIEPLAHLPGSMSMLITHPSAIAAAAPVRTRAEVLNQGMASISVGEVVDVGDPDLLATATIEFLTPSTYSIDGAGPFAYVDGGDITVHGVRVRIEGAPAAGDRFIIESNAGGIGDNRNTLRMSDILSTGFFAGGTASIREEASRLVSRVGAQTSEIRYQSEAQGALLAHARQSLDSVRGVNLDEEAVKMLEQEQMYQAAAKTVAVADLLFQSLLAALRR